MRRDEAELLFSPEALLYEDLYLLPISLSKSSFFLTPSAVVGVGLGPGWRQGGNTQNRETPHKETVSPPVCSLGHHLHAMLMSNNKKFPGLPWRSSG